MPFVMLRSTLLPDSSVLWDRDTMQADKHLPFFLNVYKLLSDYTALHTSQQ